MQIMQLNGQNLLCFCSIRDGNELQRSGLLPVSCGNHPPQGGGLISAASASLSEGGVAEGDGGSPL